MNIFQTLVLSVIEGITEFLPISSTGHLILAGELLGVAQTDFTKSFEIIIQLGAIMAVFILYFRRFLQIKYLWNKLLVAFIPAGIFGLIFYKLIKQYLIGNTIVVLCSLFIGGVVLLLVDKIFRPKPLTISQLSFSQSLLIGLFQAISMVPGVSRSAATIIGGLAVGLNRVEAVEFSFLLAIPTMTAATGLDLIKSSASFNQTEISLLITGFTGAFITALFAMKFFIKYVQKNNFYIFGIYRIYLAIIYLIFTAPLLDQ